MMTKNDRRRRSASHYYNYCFLIVLLSSFDAGLAFVPAPTKFYSFSPSPLGLPPTVKSTSSAGIQTLSLHSFPSTTKFLHNAPRQRRNNKSSLNMVTAAPTVAAITGAITGGIFAGGLHAIAGELVSCLFCCTEEEPVQENKSYFALVARAALLIIT